MHSCTRKKSKYIGESLKDGVPISNRMEKFLLHCNFSDFSKSGVPQAPNVTSPPQSVVAVTGQQATFACRSTGVPAPTLSWLFAGSTLTLAGRVAFTQPLDGSSVLTISNVQASDAGMYQCVAANSLGQAISSPATLQIAGEF